MMRSRTVLIVAGVLAASGCNFAPHYDRPKIDSGEQFKEAVHGDAGNEGWKLAEPRDAALRGNWWEIYGDPTPDPADTVPDPHVVLALGTAAIATPLGSESLSESPVSATAMPVNP